MCLTLVPDVTLTHDTWGSSSITLERPYFSLSLWSFNIMYNDSCMKIIQYVVIIEFVFFPLLVMFS